MAREVSSAALVVQNGVGYDTFMNQIEAASPNPLAEGHRRPARAGTSRWHPQPSSLVRPEDNAGGGAGDGQRPELPPARATRRTSSHGWPRSMRRFSPGSPQSPASRSKYSGTPVAITEPVADYMLQAMGADIVTPFAFQADIMNGVDPSPEDITQEEGFFTNHQAKVFCYNQQVVDSLTTTIRHTARSAGVPVVGVYETMPTPGYDYQSWMMAEVAAIQAAVEHGLSTEHL